MIQFWLEWCFSNRVKITIETTNQQSSNSSMTNSLRCFSGTVGASDALWEVWFLDSQRGFFGREDSGIYVFFGMSETGDWNMYVYIYIFIYTYIINKCWRTIFAIEPWFFRLQGLDIVSLNEHILDILRKNQGVFPPLKMTKQFFQRIGGWLNVGYTTWGGYLQWDEVQYKILGPGIQPASQTPVPWTWQIEPVDWLWRWNNWIFRCEDLLKWFFSCVCVLMFGGEVFHWYRSTFLIDRLNLVNITWT